MRWLVAAFMGLATASQAFGGLIQKPVDPNPMDVYCDDALVGQLQITNYYGWTADANAAYTPRNPYTDSGFYQDPKLPNRNGAIMQAVLNVDPDACKMNYQWVQVVTGGVGTIGPPPYLDPFNRDDPLPFYWTTPEANTADQGMLNNVPGSQFIDIASQSSANKGNSITFETALVSYSGMEIHWLAGFTWGYSINQNGGTDLANFAWTAGMSNVMSGLITNWASSPNMPFLPAPGQAPDGYTVTDDCLCVPEPGSMMLSVIAMGALGLVGAARRRKAVSGRPDESRDAA
ncbi:PEP-CTERM sorting domain-containing protein [Paludisphaera mucosa]|uniref:PEP-CTERM sorting domain-containing protein n=1 Tax=Paludisphaera mucosa TaxID=3030827 RepID=A0ABT6F8F5_9BACT|nr:PEP-CTERM sorting domain-containing protein [Paludisphaera mucosa]MDG3003877.1 PEP-CTERM sorting domain-containing protein [Paludisphaera mucosa]